MENLTIRTLNIDSKTRIIPEKVKKGDELFLIKHVYPDIISSFSEYKVYKVTLKKYHIHTDCGKIFDKDYHNQMFSHTKENIKKYQLYKKLVRYQKEFLKIESIDISLCQFEQILKILNIDLKGEKQ